MISKTTLNFLKDLKNNNNKEWFDEHRSIYQNARIELIETVQNWIKLFSSYDSEIALLEPKNCIFRINKDVRFSKDKSPYKTNLGAYLSKGGKAGNYGGYYLHIEPNNCFFGAGIYAPQTENLAKIRQEIDYDFKAFKHIIEDKKFKNTFGLIEAENKLKKAPKGYEDSNEAIEYLKLKNFIVGTKIDDKMINNSELITHLTALAKQAKPFVSFLNQALD